MANIEEGKSNLRSDVVNLEQQGEDNRVSLKEMLTKASKPALISFSEPRLTLRNKRSKEEDGNPIGGNP